MMINNHSTPRIRPVQSKGTIVTDSKGKRYLDLLADIAANVLGYAYPAIVEVASKQISIMGHVLNILTSEPPLALGKKLIELIGRDTDDTRVIFCNSGTKANKAASELAHLTERNCIIAIYHGLHGRITGALVMTGQPNKRTPSEPMPGGIEFASYGDIDFLTKTIESDPLDVTVVVLEPIQGKTSVVVPSERYLVVVRRLTKRFNVLMIVDEVQTGIGHTGQQFVHQRDGIVPDVMTLIKGLGDGLPSGAITANDHAAELFALGAHSTTFSGNPVCVAAGLAVTETFEEEKLLSRVTEEGKVLACKLTSLSHVDHVRGRGFMLGLVLCENLAKETANTDYECGAILNAPQANVLRIVPPLNLSDEEVNRAVELIDACLNDAVEAIANNGGNQGLMLRHFLADDNLTPQGQARVLQLTAELKAAPYSRRPSEGPQSVAVLLDKTLTRTRFFFDAGIVVLGGNVIVAETRNSQVGKGETHQDAVAVLGRFVSAVVWRTYVQSGLEAISGTTTMPIANMLSDEFYPYQILVNLQTIIEHKCPEGDQAGLCDKKAVYFSDGVSNMTNSYLVSFTIVDLGVTIYAPEDFQPKQDYVDRVKKAVEQAGTAVFVTTDVDKATAGADIAITGTWVSMGQENDGLDRRTPFLSYQASAELMAKANENVIFLHCLPAYHGNEVTAEIIDGSQSVVFDETENRMYTQKVLPTWLMGGQ